MLTESRSSTETASAAQVSVQTVVPRAKHRGTRLSSERRMRTGGLRQVSRATGRRVPCVDDSRVGLVLESEVLLEVEAPRWRSRPRAIAQTCRRWLLVAVGTSSPCALRTPIGCLQPWKRELWRLRSSERKSWSCGGGSLLGGLGRERWSGGGGCHRTRLCLNGVEYHFGEPEE